MENKAKVDLSITYVYLVNQDLNMSAGKIPAQVSHVAMQLCCSNSNIECYDRNSMDIEVTPILGRAVILYAPELLLQEFIHSPILERYDIKYIFDSGKTEVPKHSLTCVGFIRLKDELIEYTKTLKSVK